MKRYSVALASFVQIFNDNAVQKLNVGRVVHLSLRVLLFRLDLDRLKQEVEMDVQFVACVLSHCSECDLGLAESAGAASDGLGRCGRVDGRLAPFHHAIQCQWCRRRTCAARPTSPACRPSWDEALSHGSDGDGRRALLLRNVRLDEPGANPQGPVAERDALFECLRVQPAQRERRELKHAVVVDQLRAFFIVELDSDLRGFAEKLEVEEHRIVFTLTVCAVASTVRRRWPRARRRALRHGVGG
mmetsp:Transcript_10980/g.34947  ORF Transcript_10980/g.34947 Transcript_10980/m.34947 type:complete len:244 (-) Transcript_10980:1257-1988(-)